jgi:hypothetical protein
MYTYVVMHKRQEYKERVVKTLNFESRIYSDFEKMCNEEKTYPSHKLQEIMEEMLRKKVKGSDENNPIGINYHYYGEQKEKPLPILWDDWVTKQAAIQSIKNHNANKIEAIGLNMVFASRWRKTGIAREVRVF